MKRLIATFTFVLAAGFAAEASITGFTNTFSSPDSINGWHSAGSTPTVISHYYYVQDFDDGDPTQILSFRPSARTNAQGYPQYPACPETIPAEWLAQENHPRMFCTPAELAAVRASFQTDIRLQEYSAARNAECESFISMSDEALRALVPPKYCTIVYGLGYNTDPVYGERLQWCGWSLPFSVKDSDGTIYPNASWPDTGDGVTDPATGEQYYFVARAYGYVFTELEQKIIPALADVWALTGDQRYAHACAVLLDAVAAVYPTNIDGPIDYPGSYGRLDRPTYQVARGLHNYCIAIDLIAPSGELEGASVSSDENTIRENLIRDMLWDGGTYCMDWAEKGTQLTNGQADYLRGAGMVGILLNQPHFSQLMIFGSKNLDAMLANNFDRNGLYYETSPSYAKFTAGIYFIIAELIEAAKTAGWPDVESAYENPAMDEVLGETFNRREIGGHVPSLGDGGPDVYYNPAMQRIPGETYVHSDRFLEPQVQYAWVTLLRGTVEAGQRAAQLLAASYADEPIEIPIDRWSVFHISSNLLEQVNATPADHTLFETGSALYGAKGVAILRGGRGDGRYGSQLFFGPVNAHGQWENLTWMFVDCGVDLSYDPGYFNRAYRFGWTTQGISHQSVIVNKKSISAETDNGVIRAWKADGPVQWVLASHPNAYAAEGVTLFERLIAQADSLDGNSSGYWLDVSRVAGGTTRDDSFHTVMTNLVLDATLPTEPYAPTMFGDLFAESEFLSDYRLSGFEDESFYWIPPGDGYGFLKNPRQIDMNQTVRLTFTKEGFLKMQGTDCAVIADLLPADGRKLIVADSHAVTIAPTTPYVIRRDEGEGTSLFAKLIRAVPSGAEDQISSVETLPISGTNSLTGAWKVTWTNGTTDIWILGDGTPVETGEISTDALVAFVRLETGNVLRASCSAGTYLSAGSISLTSSVASISGTVTTMVSTNGSLYITADWENGIEDLSRVQSNSVLISLPEFGNASTWTIDHLENGHPVLEDMNAIVAAGILSPVEGTPGLCRITPPVSRFFGRISQERHVHFSKGKAVYSNGVFLGRIEDLQVGSDRFILTKDSEAVTLNEAVPVEIRELAEGDRIEIPVNLQWN